MSDNESDEMQTLTQDEVKLMTVKKLKQCCRDRGLSTSGVKAVLQKRLLDYIDSVNESDAEEDDENDKNDENKENGDADGNDDVEEQDDDVENDPGLHSTVSTNGGSNVLDELNDLEDGEDDNDNANSTNGNGNENNSNSNSNSNGQSRDITKMTDVDKFILLKQREARFGKTAQNAEQDAIEKRKERFAKELENNKSFQNNSNSNDATSFGLDSLITVSNDNEDTVENLKQLKSQVEKRKAKFGTTGVVEDEPPKKRQRLMNGNNKLSSEEEAKEREKILQRMEKFGTIESKDTLAKRLERFGTTKSDDNDNGNRNDNSNENNSNKTKDNLDKLLNQRLGDGNIVGLNMSLDDMARNNSRGNRGGRYNRGRGGRGRGRGGRGGGYRGRGRGRGRGRRGRGRGRYNNYNNNYNGGRGYRGNKGYRGGGRGFGGRNNYNNNNNNYNNYNNNNGGNRNYGNSNNNRNNNRPYDDVSNVGISREKLEERRNRFANNE